VSNFLLGENLVSYLDMIRGILIFVFVAGLAFAPVYLLEHAAMPQLLNLKQTYGNAQDTASQAAGIKL